MSLRLPICHEPSGVSPREHKEYVCCLYRGSPDWLQPNLCLQASVSLAAKKGLGLKSVSSQTEPCSIQGIVCSRLIESSQTEEMDAQRDQGTLGGHTTQKRAALLANFTDEGMKVAQEAVGLFDSKGVPILTI